MKMLYRIRTIDDGKMVYESRGDAVYIGEGIKVEWIYYRGRDRELPNRVTITLATRPDRVHRDNNNDIWID